MDLFFSTSLLFLALVIVVSITLISLVILGRDIVKFVYQRLRRPSSQKTSKSPAKNEEGAP